MHVGNAARNSLNLVRCGPQVSAAVRATAAARCWVQSAWTAGAGGVSRPSPEYGAALALPIASTVSVSSTRSTRMAVHDAHDEGVRF